LKYNPEIVDALRSQELRQILLGIMEEPSLEVRQKILGHQIEHNYDFGDFVQNMLETLDGTIRQKQKDDLENALRQMVEHSPQGKL